MIRRKTTPELLGESLHELARKKPVDKITVKDIVENCGMSVATFYRYFHDKYELSAWIFNYQMEDILLDFCNGAESWRQVLLDIITLLDRDRDFYLNALKNTYGQNSFFMSTQLRCIELLKDIVRESTSEKNWEEVLFDIKFYLRGVSYSVNDWFLNRLPYTAEELTDFIVRAVPENLKHILK